MAEQQNTPEFINDPTGHDEDVQDAVLFGRPQVHYDLAVEQHSVPEMEHNNVPAVEHIHQINSDYLDSRPDAKYDMRHKKRGPALIFNQYTFEEKEKLQKRTASDLDVAAFEKQLKRLGFDVQLYVDYKQVDLLDKVQKLAEEDHTQNDCILIAIFTHGETDGIIYAHDKKVRLNTILAKFTDENCTSFKGKPKLFFLQCCQGSGEDLGGKIKRPSTPAEEEEEEEEDEDEAVSFELSQNPDFLIAHPSAHGLKSWRRRDYGSWFIQKLCEQLEKNGTNLDLMGILTYASHHIAKLETTGGAKQVPCITSTLTRVVLFDDKKHQPGTNH